jgi:hypothetical protein
MKKLFFIFIALISLVACNDEVYNQGFGLIKNVRAKVLENGTVTYCTLDDRKKEIYHPNDTVWLNLATHQIDDTSSNTMQVVLLED